MFPRDKGGRSPPYSLAGHPVPATSASVSSGRAHSESPLPETVDQDPPVADEMASVSEQSLANHLALVTCRRGNANAQLITELMPVTYPGWFLQRAIYGACPGEHSDCRVRC
jgi:hypothetical protein